MNITKVQLENYQYSLNSEKQCPDLSNNKSIREIKYIVTSKKLNFKIMKTKPRPSYILTFSVIHKKDTLLFVDQAI